MIHIHINSQSVSLAEPTSLQEIIIAHYLGESPLEKLKSLALVLNGDLVPRHRWSSIFCQQSDQLELFSAVAGG